MQKSQEEVGSTTASGAHGGRGFHNVLLAGVADFLGDRHTPASAVINEALEIVRKFSAPESVQFINGVLDSVGKELGAPLPGRVK